MVECSTADLVALHLAAADPDREAAVAPYAASIPGIGEALEVGKEAMAERITLLSALSTLKGEGYVDEAVRRVQGLDGEHTVYYPTEAGRDHAREVRERLVDERIRVQNGQTTEVRLGEVDRYLDDPALVRALARLTDDDVLYLDEGVDQQFVDRTAEFATLEDHLDAVQAGDGRSVLVSGEAGVGKTTLVSKLTREAHDRGFRVLEGVCRRDAAEPYLPFRDALVDHIEASPFDPDGPELDDAERFEAQRTALFADVVDAVADLAADRPLVLFVDDLHSADRATLGMFDYVADNLDDAPVLLVGTYRPEDLRDGGSLAAMADEWADGDHLELAPFGPEETRGLIRWVLDARNLPERFVDLVHDRTGGNPLFVKESVKRMHEEGTVDPEYDVFPESSGEVPIPDRVEETVDIRLRTLDRDALGVLRTGSLVGETIPLPVLAAAVDLPESRLREYVDLLVDSYVWERTGDDTLRFVSGLIRETVSARVPADRREELHERIATAIREVGGAAPDRYAAVAHHYRQAGNDRRALEYYRRAAEHDREMYAHEAAVENYERALSAARDLGDDEEVLAVLENIGKVHRIAGEHDLANEHFERVRDRADDDGTRRRIARYQSRMEARRGHYDEAIRHANRGLELADDDSTEALRLLCNKAWALMQQGKFDDAERISEETLERAEGADDEVLGQALHNRASVEMARGTVDDEAIDMMERAVEVRDRAGDRRGVSESLNNLGGMLLQVDDVEGAREAMNRSLEISEEMGDAYGSLSARNNLGKIHRAAGDVERALECYEIVLEESRRLGARQTLANALANAGKIYRRRNNDLVTAADYLERSLEIQREMDNTRWQVGISASLAKTYALQADLEAGLSHARRALDLAEDAGMPGAESDAHRVLGDLHAEREDYRRALDHHEAALELASENDKAQQSLSAHNSLAEVNLHLDRVEAAFEHAERAVEIADGWDADSAERRARRVSLYARRALGQCHREAGEYDRAESLFRDILEGIREIELDQFEPFVLYDLGKTLRERGDHEEAADYLERARDRALDVDVLLIVEKARSELGGISASNDASV